MGFLDAVCAGMILLFEPFMLWQSLQDIRTSRKWCPTCNSPAVPVSGFGNVKRFQVDGASVLG